MWRAAGKRREHFSPALLAFILRGVITERSGEYLEEVYMLLGNVFTGTFFREYFRGQTEKRRQEREKMKDNIRHVLDEKGELCPVRISNALRELSGVAIRQRTLESLLSELADEKVVCVRSFGSPNTNGTPKRTSKLYRLRSAAQNMSS